MATTILYGFLEDDALKLSTTLDLSASTDQGYGVLTLEPANYLVNRGILGDSRTSRMTIVNHAPARGGMRILFDQDRVDLDELKNMTDADSQAIFNILERVYLQQDYTDENIEHILTTATSYSGYVAGTFSHGSTYGTPIICDNTGNKTTIRVYDSLIFSYKSDTVEIFFHIWVGRKAFSEEYPFITITQVIPPYSPDKLVDPTTFLATSNVDVLTNSATYIFARTNVETVVRDQNGIHTFKTKYNISTTQDIEVTFALAYCGREAPSSLECRKAIRDYLTEATGVTDSVLEELFPDLFIEARYYIIPLWNNVTELSDRTIYPSIQSISKAMTAIKTIYPETSDDFIDNYAYLITNAQNTLFSVVIPDELNDAEHMNFYDEYPQYQNYSTMTDGWKYLPTATQEFAGKLIRCMAVLTGATTSTEFTKVVDGSLSYLTFTSNQAEFYVLEQQAFLSVLPTGS